MAQYIIIYLGSDTPPPANMDVAIKMAKTCPYLEMGSLEVAELMQMPD